MCVNRTGSVANESVSAQPETEARDVRSRSRRSCDHAGWRRLGSDLGLILDSTSGLMALIGRLLGGTVVALQSIIMQVDALLPVVHQPEELNMPGCTSNASLCDL